jgi:arginine:ornithine antiporter/lysine permease
MRSFRQKTRSVPEFPTGRAAGLIAVKAAASRRSDPAPALLSERASDPEENPMNDIKPLVTTSATAKPAAAPGRARQLGVLLLSGVVIGSMIGGGAFNLPQNMAAGAGLAAVVIAWIVTFVGMFFLSNSFRTLADQRPDLTAGIYTYAREGFGKFAGFMMAWGYWLSAAFGNVAFAVLIMQILGYFFPVFGKGDNIASLIGGSVLIWVMCFIVMAGVRRAASLNVLASILNVTAIGAALVVMALYAKAGHFSLDAWGESAQLGSVLTQVKSTMLVTLWVFIGIEGAVVVSDRARDQRDVGKATFIGLAVCTVLYALLSILPFGLATQPELAALGNPSAAYLLQSAVGPWGAIFINVSLLIAVLSCWLAWTILVAELPMMGAKDGVFPRFLAKENRHHAAAPSLWLSSAVMQVMMFVVLFAHDAWIWLISITGVMVLPPYLASAAYLWKFSTEKSYHGGAGETRGQALITGILGTAYAVWLLYAAGPKYLLMSTVMFMVGVPMFWWAQRELNPGGRVFTGREIGAVVLLGIAAAAAIALFATGVVSLS